MPFLQDLLSSHQDDCDSLLLWVRLSALLMHCQGVPANRDPFKASHHLEGHSHTPVHQEKTCVRSLFLSDECVCPWLFSSSASASDPFLFLVSLSYATGKTPDLAVDVTEPRRRGMGVGSCALPGS